MWNEKLIIYEEMSHRDSHSYEQSTNILVIRVCFLITSAQYLCIILNE